MGGHGGLNILPQKRWNVYNFDNREKVRKDEEEAAEKEREQAEEQRKRDGEARLTLLRERARRRAIQGDEAEQADADENVQRHERGDAAEVSVPSQDAVAAAPADQSTATHINFFAELEAAERKASKSSAAAADDPREGGGRRGRKEDKGEKESKSVHR